MASDLDRLRAMVDETPRDWSGDAIHGDVWAGSQPIVIGGNHAPLIAALRNAAPELLAVAEAAEQAVWEQTESRDAHRFHQALADALDALRAKLREVPR